MPGDPVWQGVILWLDQGIQCVNLTMKIISSPVKRTAVLSGCNTYFKTMIKAVVDIEKSIIAIDAELHADLESALLDQGSVQENLWGINLYLEKTRNDWIDYVALINIRPSMENRSMEIQDFEIREKIANIVEKLITE
jgi:hypothetical protein